MQKGGDKLGYESEAFAIYDTMKYIKPEVHTLCVGTAFGESAMLLASGTPVSSPSRVAVAVLEDPHPRRSHRLLLFPAMHMCAELTWGVFAGQEGCIALINHHAEAAHAALPADAGV